MKNIATITLMLLLAACGGNGDHAHSDRNGNDVHREHAQEHHGEHADQDISRLDEADRRDTPAPHPLSGTSAERFDAMLDEYFQLSDALVAASASEAAAFAGRLNEEAERFDTGHLDTDVREETSGWMETVRQRSREIAGESDVEEQRASYLDLSETLIAMVEAFGHEKDVLYHQRCPMVNGGNGDWLSMQERIMNPYHGDRMLHCGMTVRIL